MALTIEKLINNNRFNSDSAFLQFLAYLPFGLILLVVRIFLVVILWIASILLPNKWAVRQMLTTLACWTFGLYVKLKGQRDPRCSVLVANYVSCLDSLAAAHALGTISLRKWKVPPFFASALGIRNAAQFARKQHFAECPSKPVLVQPEGGPTNGSGLLTFTDWPFQIGNRVQPVAICVSRPFTRVCTPRQSSSRFPWREAAWFLLSPATTVSLVALPTVERHHDDDQQFVLRIRQAIAEALQIEVTEFSWDDLQRGAAGGGGARRAHLTRLAAQVKEVLPAVPLTDILRDLAVTRSVDVTITNFLEGLVPYIPETDPALSMPSSSSSGSTSSAPRYVTPVPTGVFPKNAKERQVSFQERKSQMIAEARRRYIEKRGLNVAMS